MTGLKVGDGSGLCILASFNFQIVTNAEGLSSGIFKKNAAHMFACQILMVTVQSGPNEP